jgi:hypothetical protein
MKSQGKWIRLLTTMQKRNSQTTQKADLRQLLSINVKFVILGHRRSRRWRNSRRLTFASVKSRRRNVEGPMLLLLLRSLIGLFLGDFEANVRNVGVVAARFGQGPFDASLHLILLLDKINYFRRFFYKFWLDILGTLQLFDCCTGTKSI